MAISAAAPVARREGGVSEAENVGQAGSLTDGRIENEHVGIGDIARKTKEMKLERYVGSCGHRSSSCLPLVHPSFDWFE